jgi:anti-sigma B factor antagonist
MTTVRSVVVQELPEKLTVGYTLQFFREIESQLKTERPYLVFDFSNVRQFDSSGVQMLLYCMEEVMKRNGDLKLAALPSGPAVMLELTRVDRLFEIFEDVQDAVESFYRLPLQALPGIQPEWQPVLALERDQVKVAA